jgi:RNA polymerase-binding transcription factor DksA
VPDQTVQPEVRAQLEAERAQLRDQVAGLERAGRGAADFDENFADSGQVAAEQGENAVLANRLRSELDEVERALVKLDDGTYGQCEVCGGPIAEARLEAMPATRFCIDHA